MWLYNINNNSIYSDNYICSYDSKKDAKHEYYPRRCIDANVCVPFNKTIKDNNIITQFINEYKYENKFYCSLISINNNYMDFKHEKYYTIKSYKYILSLFIFQYVKFVFMLWPFYIGYYYYELSNLSTNSNDSSKRSEHPIPNEGMSN